MPDLTADEIIQNRHVRTFMQFGGPQPGNPVSYYGQDAQYLVVEGVSIPDGNGSIEPVWHADPRVVGQYRLVGRQFSPPDLAEASLVFRERHGAVPRQLQKMGCRFNVYQPAGTCADLSDWNGGWSDYVLILSGGVVNGNKDAGARSAFAEDNPLETTVPVALADIYPVGALSFADNATAIITLEVIDVVYGSREQCGDCGPQDDGTSRIYAVTTSSGSTPGTAPRLIYTVNGGDTWVQASIDGLGDIENPIAIDVVGPYLVVVTRTAGGTTTGGYYYSRINADTGVPGTWTKVTSGFVASFQPYDLFVLGPREIFFCADGGYIYKAVDITAGVSVVSAATATSTALRRIGGDGYNCLVAVGGSGTVIYSVNRGVSWAAASATPLVATLQAVAVLSDRTWWVGSANGTLWYTVNGGASWSQKTFSGSGAGQVYDILAVTDEVLFFSHSTATPTARIFASWNGGADFTNERPRILNLPTFNRANRLAAPNAHSSIAANNLAVAGLSGGGTDGVLLLGKANRL